MSDHDESGDEPRKRREDSTSESEAEAEAEADEAEADEVDADEAPSSADAAPREPKRKASSGKSASSDKGRDRHAKPSASPSSIRSSSAALFAVVALAAGGAAGWFGHIEQAKAMLRADSTPAAAGSASASGPCRSWEKQICATGTEQSAACQQAKAASELLTPATCEAALQAMPATLAKIKAGRVPCETLVGKLCTDLPPGSATCQMVKERTPSFPSERCREMLGTYDTVLAEVKMLDEQVGQMGHGMPGGMPPGAMPPGAMPPGAMPPGHP
jgi:hypothetical protein